MTKTILLGLVVASVLSITLIPAFAGGHLMIDDITVENRGNNGKAQSVHIDVSANVPVPPDGSDYGWAVETTKGFLVITSHPTIGDDSTAQPPDEEYHTHFLTAAPSDDCDAPAATFATKNEVGRLSIMDDKIWVENVPRGLAGDMSEKGFSFTLELRDGPDADDNPSLCIDSVDEFP